MHSVRRFTVTFTAIAVADVTAHKDEKVAVVVDHDKPGDEAMQVRFESAK
jgi:hypothetical protein